MLDKFERLWKEWYALKQGVGKQIIKKKKKLKIFSIFLRNLVPNFVKEHHEHWKVHLHVI